MPAQPVRDGEAIVVFDGVCVFCSGWVEFLLRRDRRGRLRFAAMQSEAGRALLSGNGLNPDDPLSFLLLDACGARVDSDAAIGVMTRLGWPWRAVGALRLLPRALRDRGYRWLARNRYRWFGRKPACYLPDAGMRDRFL
ncbi:thiol-disulfide oxidoreductase DCC family protein [Luteimonas aquatica]|uniref:thiol-disulfide oxidoreductase DCC family protein n=1 Tax=Luteimonas aquatica TaxID=450364 RepID=UPI001F57F981|nr:thiol-disulfide oxidoreductase DCC family protein [Luteimonas aquatica]